MPHSGEDVMSVWVGAEEEPRVLRAADLRSLLAEHQAMSGIVAVLSTMRLPDPKAAPWSGDGMASLLEEQIERLERAYAGRPKP